MSCIRHESYTAAYKSNGYLPRFGLYQDGYSVSQSRSGYKTEAGDMLVCSTIRLQVLASSAQHQPDP
jgi:hypothetical protein